jgi:signal transduction histidine kinase
MLNRNLKPAPDGLRPDQDAALLLRQLGLAVVLVAVILMGVLFLNGDGIRPAISVALVVGVAMLLLVRYGRLMPAAHVLCWGLLLAGGTGVYMFGLRSSGAVVIPLAIMAGGWLLGRAAAIGLAAAGSAVTAWVYVEHLQGHVRNIPQVITSDALTYVAIFSVTAILATAMAATLRLQYDKVNALAEGLQESNRTLEERVAERSAQLAGVQQKVMETEKLTSLGSMVAGISHELNTPLGNALTVSTTLEDQVRGLAQRVESGKLTRSDMAEFLSNAADVAQLTTQSVRRAAELVASFKQVAADQTSEQRRTFMLDRVVADNIAALRPSLKNSTAEVVLNVPAGIECDTFPGPIGQVITNLVQNAVVHGFEEFLHGRVDVVAMLQGDRVQIDVRDNGSGMPAQVLARVFEPFFTTRLGRGGSGLGLTVSHRIAMSVLGGDLTVKSAPGQGSTFTLTFPRKLSGGL